MILSVIVISLLLSPGITSQGSAKVSSPDHLSFAPREFIVKFSEVVGEAPIGIVEGRIKTGIESIDILNDKFGVVSVERLFPQVNESPKAVALYQTLGLGRIYKFTVSTDIDVVAAVEEYKAELHCQLLRLSQ